MQRNEDGIDVTPSTSKRTREENISPNFADVIEATFDVEDIENEPSSANLPQRKKKRTDQLDLLDKQINIQQSFCSKVTEGIDAQEEHFKNVNEGLRKLTKSVERLGDYQKKTSEIMKDFLEEAKRHNQAMEKNAVEKLKVKKELLSLVLGGIDKQLGLKN